MLRNNSLPTQRCAEGSTVQAVSPSPAASSGLLGKAVTTRQCYEWPECNKTEGRQTFFEEETSAPGRAVLSAYKQINWISDPFLRSRRIIDNKV